MRNQLDDFTPLTMDHPTEIVTDDYSDVLGERPTGRLLLDESAPALEMEDLPGLSLDEPAAVGDSLPGDPADPFTEAGDDEFASLAELPPIGADAAGEDDPFACLALDDEPAMTSEESEPPTLAHDGAETVALPSDAVRFALPAVLDLDQAENLRATLLERIGGDLVIDAAAVSRIDTPCIEVLISASRQWFDDGFALQWENPSAPFTTSLDRLGLTTDSLRIEGVH